MGTSDEPLPSLPKVLFGLKFSKKMWTLFQKNISTLKGRKEGHEHHQMDANHAYLGLDVVKKLNCLETLWMAIMASQINKPENWKKSKH